MFNFKNIKSVAIIGASEDSKKIGNILIGKNQNFEGKIYGINPRGGSAYGIDFVKNITDLPEIPDIAVFAIPETFIYESLEEIGKFGIKKAIIITAGFKEIGNIEGEEKLKQIANKYNIRILGPNCLGYGNTHQKLNLSFGGNFFDTGNIGIISQSGAMAVAITDILSSKNLGFSTFFSLGNKVNIDETDLLKEFENDTNTDVLGIYLESINRGSDFIKVLKELTMTKPVIIMMGGMSSRGKIATASHTGSLSGDKNMYEAALKQGGAILTYSIAEFFEYLQIFSLNAKKRINGNPIIITNAGGPGVLATDQCEFMNLELMSIDPGTSRLLRENMPTMMSAKNPIDIIGDADSIRVIQILENISKLTTPSDIIFLFTIQATTDIESISKAIIEFKDENPEYCIFVGLIGGDTVDSAEELLTSAGIFTSRTTEGMIGSYRKLLQSKKPREELNTPNIINKKPREEANLLNQNETEKLLKHYGINTTYTLEYSHIEDILEYCKHNSGPYIMKIGGKKVAHKTEMNGVSGRLDTNEQVIEAYEQLTTRAKQYNTTENIITIGKYIETSPKIELFFGAKRDPIFGETFIIGAGGIFLTILNDTRIHIGEWNGDEITEVIYSLRSYPALTGYRKQQSADIKILTEIFSELSKLFFEHPEIEEIDINPVLFENGIPYIADAKFYLSREV
ncbi:acetate--CoA ligase family protein [Candidatus Gracilibacteria bacterium]|nr:acetate--CoA ligase family protein [Candidatus Gracilibacteria bacterium]